MVEVSNSQTESIRTTEKLVSLYIYDDPLFSIFTPFFRSLTEIQKKEYLLEFASRPPDQISLEQKPLFNNFLEQAKSNSYIAIQVYYKPSFYEIICQFWRQNLNFEKLMAEGKKEYVLTSLKFQDDECKKFFEILIERYRPFDTCKWAS